MYAFLTQSKVELGVVPLTMTIAPDGGRHPAARQEPAKPTESRPLDSSEPRSSLLAFRPGCGG